MPPKPVLCDMCGGKFFKSSIAIHQKQCAAKKIAQTVFCPVCELPVNNDEYAGHLEACKDANAGKKKKRPAKNAAPQRLPEKCVPAVVRCRRVQELPAPCWLAAMSRRCRVGPRRSAPRVDAH
jgi:hypothetical protein